MLLIVLMVLLLLLLLLLLGIEHDMGWRQLLILATHRAGQEGVWASLKDTDKRGEWKRVM
jgi:hypothetical protein